MQIDSNMLNLQRNDSPIHRYRMHPLKYLLLLSLLIWSCDNATRHHEVTIVNRTGSGSYELGEKVYIESDNAPDGEAFFKWEGDTFLLDQSRSPKTSFTMPFQDLQLTATFKDLPRYNLTVESGNGSGAYLAGTIVQVYAFAAAEGKVFDHWEGDVAFLEDSTSMQSTIEIPEFDISITAIYVPNPSNLVSFSQEVLPIMKVSCTNTSCHSYGTVSEPLTNYQEIKSILPSVRSVIANASMPVAPYELTQEERELIIEWIDQGGLNN